MKGWDRITGKLDNCAFLALAPVKTPFHAKAAWLKPTAHFGLDVQRYDLVSAPVQRAAISSPR